MRRVHVTLKTPPKLSGHSAGVHCCAVKWCACSYIQCWSSVHCNAKKWRACVVCMGRAGMNIPAPLLFGIMQTRKKCRKKISNTSVHAMKLYQKSSIDALSIYFGFFASACQNCKTWFCVLLANLEIHAWKNDPISLLYSLKSEAIFCLLVFQEPIHKFWCVYICRLSS